MGFDCGFDMVPKLTDSKADSSGWFLFVEEIKTIYEDDPLVLVTPKMITFQVGEHPVLPIVGQKFLRFSSKVSGSLTAAAEPYIREVYTIARKYFNGRLQFWHELADNYGYYSWTEVHESIRSYEDTVGGSLIPERGVYAYSSRNQ